LNLRDQFLAQWQKSARLEDVADLAKAANNDPNRIRNAVNKFTDKPENTSRLLPNELELLQRAGERNLGEKVLGVAGRLGLDMGSISRNPNVIVPTVMATARSGLQAGGGYLLRAIEARPVAPKARPPVAPVAPSTPLLPGPAAPRGLPAPETIMVPGGANGALRPATEVERAAMYAQRGQTPELEVPAMGAPRAQSNVQQQASGSVRRQYQEMGLTPDVLQAQRKAQVTAAEAQKAIQDAAAAAQRTNQVAGSAPPPTVADMFQQAQASAADRAAATGDTPSLGSVGEALRRALQGF
jgi:hypothetical protein